MEVSAKLKSKIYKVSQNTKRGSYIVSETGRSHFIKDNLKIGVVALYDEENNRLLNKNQQIAFRKSYQLEKKIIPILGQELYDVIDQSLEPSLLISDYLVNKKLEELIDRGLDRGLVSSLQGIIDKSQVEKKHYFEMVSLEPSFLKTIKKEPLASKIKRKDHRYVIVCLKKDLEEFIIRNSSSKTYIRKITKQLFDANRN